MALAALRPFASWRARPRGSIRKFGASLWQALLAAVLVVAMVAVVAGILIRQRANTLATTQAEAEGLAHALAGEAGQAFGAVDHAIAEASAQVDALDAADPAHLPTALRSLRLQERLATLVASRPPAASVALLAPDGHLVSTSRIWPAPPNDTWQLPLFLALRTRHGRAPAIELSPPPADGRGARSIYLARRVEDRDGHLLAIATGALSLPYFQSFYRAVAPRGQSVVAVYRRDGTLLFCYPQRARAPLAGLSRMSRVPAGSPWFAAVAAGGGAFEQSGPGRPTRIIAVQPVAAYPVVVAVGFSEPAALAAWRRQAIFAGIAFAIAVLGVGVLLRNLLGQFRRLEHRTLELGRTAAALSASEARLAEKSALLETTLEQMDQGIMMIDAGRRVALCSQRARELLELPAALMEGRPLFDEVLQYQAAHQEFVSADVPMRALLRRGGYLDKPHAYERQRPNGMVIEVRTVPLPGGGAVRTYTDITARRAAEAQLRFFAHHDELTRLANRMLLHRELNARAAVVMEEGAHGRFAVHYIDLDRFKAVNDTRGHDVGDRLLVEVANRLRGCVRETDIIARMGGDEFAILQAPLDGPEAAMGLAARIVERLGAPYGVGGQRLLVGASVGVALCPDHGCDPQTLLRRADLALYRAKLGGRGSLACYAPGLEENTTERFVLEQDLRAAIASDQFTLAYQPVCDTQSLAVVGFEALLRWRHPVRGAVEPRLFIPLAEECGLIGVLGQWALETACAEAAAWARPCRIAVNVSPAQFRAPDLPARIAETLARTGLDPRRLQLEVTEGLLLEDTDAVLETMRALRAQGIGITLDDFGTAHASLSYLRRFPFDTLKIDQSFVRSLGEDAGAGSIVQAVLTLAHGLGLVVVAEGVETEQQLALLRAMRCKLVQGFLVGRPAPAARVRELLWSAADPPRPAGQAAAG